MQPIRTKSVIIPNKSLVKVKMFELKLPKSLFLTKTKNCLLKFCTFALKSFLKAPRGVLMYRLRLFGGGHRLIQKFSCSGFVWKTVNHFNQSSYVLKITSFTVYQPFHQCRTFLAPNPLAYKFSDVSCRIFWSLLSTLAIISSICPILVKTGVFFVRLFVILDNYFLIAFIGFVWRVKKFFSGICYVFFIPFSFILIFFEFFELPDFSNFSRLILLAFFAFLGWPIDFW